MLGWIGWIIFGLIVGIVGKFLMPGRDPGGFIVTILLGIAGALLGGFVGRALGFYQRRGAGRLHHGGARCNYLAGDISRGDRATANGLSGRRNQRV